MNYKTINQNKYEMEIGYSQLESLIFSTPNYVGYYEIGKEGGLQLRQTTKPKWLHRKMMDICLGIKWIDYEKKK
jgi:hypothetical protein